MNPPEPTIAKSQVSLKTILTVSFTVLGVAALAWFVVYARLAIMIVLGAALISLALHHGVDWLRAKGLGHRLAASLVLLAFFTFIVGGTLLVVLPAVSQGAELGQQVGTYVERIQESPLYERARSYIGGNGEEGGASAGEGGGMLGTAVDPALRVVGGVFTFLAAIVALLATVIFMVLMGGRLVRALLDEAIPERRERYERIGRNIYVSVGGYLNGLLILCGLNAVFTTIILAVLGVPYFLPLGLLSGVASLVPLAGATIAGIAISLIAWATSGLQIGLVMAGFFVVYQQVENNVFAPLVYRRTVKVNPLITLVALIVLAEMAGIVGALLAVPAVAAIQIVIRELMAVRREHLNLPRKGPLSGPEAPPEAIEATARIEHEVGPPGGQTGPTRPTDQGQAGPPVH